MGLGCRGAGPPGWGTSRRGRLLKHRNLVAKLPRGGIKNGPFRQNKKGHREEIRGRRQKDKKKKKEKKMGGKGKKRGMTDKSYVKTKKKREKCEKERKVGEFVYKETRGK